MKHIRFFTLTALALVMCVGNCFGQEQTTAPAAQAPQQDYATIYIYRHDYGLVASSVFLFFKKTRAVYFREGPAKPKQKNRKIAALRNKQYFVMHLPAGKYVFDTRMMWGNLELDVVAGREYYLWVDQGHSCPSEDPMMSGPSMCESRSASISSVPLEQWEKENDELKPIKKGDVKDRKLVIIPSGPPPNNQTDQAAAR